MIDPRVWTFYAAATPSERRLLTALRRLDRIIQRVRRRMRA